LTQTTIVAPITSTVRFPLNPVHALLPADAATGLSVASVALLNQIRTVDRQRLIKRLGAVDAQTLTQIDEALKISLDLF
jgi:mRNA interferase MazF